MKLQSPQWRPDLVWRPTPRFSSAVRADWAVGEQARRSRPSRWWLVAVGVVVLAGVLQGVHAGDERLRQSTESFAPDPLSVAEWNHWLCSMESRRAADDLAYANRANLVSATAQASDLESDTSRFYRVDVTGYSSRVEETDADPFITAMCTITSPGVIAMSRDLLRTFTPDAPFDFGDKILIPGVGIYSVEDTMHSRWTRRCDIWFPSTEEAYAWGRRTAFISEVKEETPVLAYQVPFDRTGVVELRPESH